MKKFLLLFTSSLLIGCQSEKSTDPPSQPDSPEHRSTDVIPAPDSFVGLKLEEAEALAKEADLPFRVIKRDGEEFPITRDYRPERLNFTVEKGVVTKVTNG